MAMFHPAIAPALLTETGGAAHGAPFSASCAVWVTWKEKSDHRTLLAEGRHDRYAEVAREIVTRNPDVIVTGTIPS